MKEDIFISEHIILNVVCSHFNLTPEQVTSKSRKNELVFARKVCAYFMRKYSRLTLQKIGNLLNVRHEVIIYFIRKIKEEGTFYKSVRIDLINIRKSLRISEINTLSKNYLN